MNQRIALSTLVVRDYDAAIEFFVEKLGFHLVEDTYIESEDKRWVTVAPPGSNKSGLLLANASGDVQVNAIGRQTGNRVAFFLYTDNFWRDYEAYKAKGIRFVRNPVEQSYGTVAVFEDIGGNLWDLLEPNTGWLAVFDLLCRFWRDTAAKRGPTPKLQRQIALVAQLPRTKQKSVSEMLDTVIQKAAH